MADLNKRRLLLLLLLIRRRMKRKPRRRVWIREIFKCRSTLGEYHRLVEEIKLVDHSSFYRHFHMSPVMFDDLLSRVGPVITRMTTQLRSPVPPGEILAVTLHSSNWGFHADHILQLLLGPCYSVLYH